MQADYPWPAPASGMKNTRARRQKFYGGNQVSPGKSIKKENSAPPLPAGFYLCHMKASQKIPQIGILGGGQLGRMLLQAAANYPVQVHVLENDAECPAAHLCQVFVNGDIRDYEDV